MPRSVVPDQGTGVATEEPPAGRPHVLLGEGGLGAAYATMGAAEAAELLLRLYSIHGALTKMATEKDDTFRVDACAGRFVLKVANPSEDPSHLDFEITLLGHVAGADGSLPVPHVVPDRSGRACSEIRDSAGQVRWVRLLTYLDGAPWDRQPSSPAQREQVGEALAALRFATAAFHHPAEGRMLAWDARQVLGLGSLLEDITHPERRRRLAEGLERIAELQSRILALPTQVLHNDFNKSNLLVDPDAPSFLTGILDFGDSVRTAIAVDVATALLNQLTAATDAETDIFRDARDVLRGYLRRAPLSKEELALVPHLVMARVIARALITTHRARLFPGNATYILRNTPPGWVQLDWFLRRSVDEVSEVLQ